MSDEAVVTAEVPEEPTEPTTPGTKSHAATLHEDVARALKESGVQAVRKRVLDTLVEEKLEERKKLVLDVLGRLKQQRQEIIQMEKKGEQKFGLDSKPVGGMTYTKQQLEEMKKAKEKAGKMEKALDRALADGDYSKLQECMK